ncbi:hypothetical protein U5A82_07200 [Sphingobium sp. CR2-8]|uniref:hypothetical protein n=1 Tax=Sphingobium sp. CR2-8 TaxID=1306534 RepID=UPI002DB8A11D|nr:hypothetical protein [Sphingobium sp. CR2-8]MEC3910275.1 hypothetical protein [Sphingobium sp. CR2-8]
MIQDERKALSLQAGGRGVALSRADRRTAGRAHAVISAYHYDIEMICAHPATQPLIPANRNDSWRGNSKGENSETTVYFVDAFDGTMRQGGLMKRSRICPAWR